MKKSTMIIGAALALAAAVPGVPAHADPPAGSGWDKKPDLVVGGGSDTTYLMSQRLEQLYNAAPGCLTITSQTSPDKGKCSDTTAAPTGPTNGNYDHDVFVGAFPTGSSAGVKSLLPGADVSNPYNPAIDYARSSRGPSGTEAADLTFWGYARDGISVLTFGSRANVLLTKQDLKDIYSCAKTNWNQFTDVNGTPLAAGTIIPWEVNTNSGTYASFRTYVDNVTTGTCIRKLQSTNDAPFENDVKPILADPGPDNVLGNADDEETNYVIWMSSANWFTYPFTKNGKVNGTGAAINSNLVAVEGIVPTDSNIFDSTYPIRRTVYQVTREQDADCNTVPGTDGVCNNANDTVYGTTSGKGGAVREFTQWLCRRTSATQTTNTVTGVNYRTEINNAIAAEGFQTLSAAVPGLRTPGYACSVSN